jgi:hypothetical protein
MASRSQQRLCYMGNQPIVIVMDDVYADFAGAKICRKTALIAKSHEGQSRFSIIRGALQRQHL